MENNINWQPIENYQKENVEQIRHWQAASVLLIARYPSWGRHTRVHHGHWDRIDNKWVYWPHDFPPTHFAEVTYPEFKNSQMIENMDFIIDTIHNTIHSLVLQSPDTEKSIYIAMAKAKKIRYDLLRQES